MTGAFSQILDNKILITGIIAWAISQVLKVIIELLVHRKVSLDRLFGDGGIPSSHSATVTSVALAVALTCGWNSVEFAIAFILAIIVMHDAMGVRLETGKQAKVINQMLEFFQSIESSELSPEEKLKELVGHTPLQVLSGFILGIIIALVRYM